VQVSPAQHGEPVAPHVTDVPLKHTDVAPVVWPDSVHVPVLQQPPPAQVVPLQHASPERPHCVHLPPVHVPPPAHAV
jgi:hypothetical protein